LGDAAQIDFFEFEQAVVLFLSHAHISDFSFLKNIPRSKEITELWIVEGSTLSFDYFTSSLPLLDSLVIHYSSLAQPIPHIPNLSSLHIRHKDAFNLIQSNSHISGRLTIDLNLPHHLHHETVHISLELIGHFPNITEFTYTGYTTTLDVYHLHFSENLTEIHISRDTYSISNLDYLAKLPNLNTLLLPWQLMIPAIESGIFHDNVFISGGS